MIRKQTTLSLSPHHKKYSKPPLQYHQYKPNKHLQSHNSLIAFINTYYRIHQNYQVNGSFSMLHYYFHPKQHVEQQQYIDLGIPYIQSQHLGQADTINNQFWQQHNTFVQQKYDLSEENFTDNEMKDNDEEEGGIITKKLAVFGTNCQTISCQKSIEPYEDYLNSKSINSQSSFPEIQQTLQKTAYFQKQPPKNKIKINLKLSKEIENSIKKTTQDQLQAVNIQNVNNSNNILISKKNQFLEKIKKQKQKKQKQWDKYIQKDKQYLRKYLK